MQHNVVTIASTSRSMRTGAIGSLCAYHMQHQLVCNSTRTDLECVGRVCLQYSVCTILQHNIHSIMMIHQTVIHQTVTAQYENNSLGETQTIHGHDDSVSMPPSAQAACKEAHAHPHQQPCNHNRSTALAAATCSTSIRQRARLLLGTYNKSAACAAVHAGLGRLCLHSCWSAAAFHPTNALYAAQAMRGSQWLLQPCNCCCCGCECLM
jgi:hypothetical protein